MKATRDLSSGRVKKLQRLPESLDGISTPPSGRVTAVRDIGAMMSSHHGVLAKIRYNGAVWYKWHWFVLKWCRYRCDKRLEEDATCLEK